MKRFVLYSNWGNEGDKFCFILDCEQPEFGGGRDRFKLAWASTAVKNHLCVVRGNRNLDISKIYERVLSYNQFIATADTLEELKEQCFFAEL